MARIKIETSGTEKQEDMHLRGLNNIGTLSGAMGGKLHHTQQDCEKNMGCVYEMGIDVTDASCVCNN